MKQKKKNNKPPLFNYNKYLGMAFQMAIIMFVFTFAGLKTDQYLQLKFPVFTLILSIVGVGLALYTMIKDLIK